MNSYESQARLFRILMHPGRLAILDELRTGEACVCHLEAVLGLRQAYISQQLMVLRDAGVVGDRREGWNVYYCVIKPQIFRVMEAARSMLGRSPRGRSPYGKRTCSCPHCSGERSAASTAMAKSG